VLVTIIVAALVAIDFVIRVLSLVLIPKNRRPQTALAWLLAIYLIPYVGIALFLLLGNSQLPAMRRQKQSEINNLISETTEGFDRVGSEAPWPNWLTPVVELNRTLGAMPMVGGNSSTLFHENDASLAAMIEDINRARRSIHVEFYILALDETTQPFFDALSAAVQRGVTVRVLLDHLGSFQYAGFRPATRALTRMGATWHLMLPFQPLRGRIQRPDLRNHRKLLIVDGEVGFTGSQNVIDPGYESRKNARRGMQWKDSMVRFEGPVVAGLDAVFVTDWYAETDELLVREAAPPREMGTGTLDCQVVPSGPGFPGENNLRMFNSLVYAAQKKIILVSPYFVPDGSMLYAITTAAQSGLDVQLFVSEIGDQFFVYHAQRSYYEALLRAGVRIFLYASPTILHAKHFTIDDEVSVIGSSNMDMRSFSLDFEVSVMVWGGTFLQHLRAIEDDYRSRSHELTLEVWLRRPRLSRALDNVARLTAAVQ
jgi:cardiolipin synthase